MGKYPLVILVAFAFCVLVTIDCATAQNCTLDDYVAEYTECRTNTNTHTLVWYKKPSSTCSDGVPQPPIQFNLPCNISCSSGQYLPIGSTTCANCSAGTFSLGGAIHIDSWYEWPTNLLTVNTYCKNTYGDGEKLNASECSGWVLDGFYTSSGNTSDSQTSVLELSFILQAPGYVNFEFLVDAEVNWDGLSLYIDGGSVIDKLSSTEGILLIYQQALEIGYHFLSFEYSKDSSYSTGIDQALISILEIGGWYNSWDVVCEPCEEGEYAASGDGSCTRCPVNTYAGWAAGSCTPCNSNQYAIPGSASCSPRPICTSDDYQSLAAKACTNNRQSVNAGWLEPHFCTPGATLPPVTTVQCPSCNPGFYRDYSTQICTACPTGKAVGGVGAQSCQGCPGGSSATKIISRTKFDYWLDNESTGCSGDCSTNGWRLRSNYIDSGEGHGVEAVSWYQMVVTFETDGFLYFQHYFNCDGLCALSFFDSYSGSETGITFKDQGQLTTTTIPFSAGIHSLRFTFVKIGLGADTDLAQIFNLTIVNVAEGGAPKCVPCPAGQVSTAGSSVCSQCPIGSTSDSTSTTCIPCTGNTFTPTVGSACMPCGPGTFASADHSSCSSPCTFNTTDVETPYNITYDFSSLTPYFFSTLEYTDSDYDYYVNFCTLSNMGICFDIAGNEIDTYVCQYDTVVDWSIGLGSFPAYYPLPERYPANVRGLEVVFTGGAKGCAPFYGTAVARTTNIALVCDPYSGSGFLNGVYDEFGNDLTENPKCTYNLELKTIYACPVCAEGSDWSYYFTSCNNGKRLKVYYWFENPPRCHDGTSPPALSEEVECSHSTVNCPAGQYLDETTTGGAAEHCRPCELGTYSVGGGQYISSWPVAALFDPVPPLPSPFNSFCSGVGCTSWSGGGDFVRSGNGDTSLVATYTLVQDGYVSFSYKVYSAKAGLFQLDIDGNKTNLNTAGISNTNWTTFTAPLPAGRHQLLWLFTNGRHSPPSDGTLEGAVIGDITVYGIDYHASECFPCPAGTFSEGPSSNSCIPCPMNTYSSGRAVDCIACDPQYEYSLGGEGASECLSRPLCTPVDYQKQYLPCVNGSAVVTYMVYDTSLCVDYGPTPTNTTCGTCPLGLFWGSGVCNVCGPEQVYNNITSQCENIAMGYLNIHHDYYFVPFYNPGDPNIGKKKRDMSLPPDFKTWCTGSCVTNGWRATGDGADSGYHGSAAVDSSLVLSNTWQIDGKLIFTYDVQGKFGTFTGLQLFVDNTPIPIDTPFEGQAITVTVPIPIGDHTILWNFHQNAGDISIASIGPIELIGTLSGAAEAVPCPAGTKNPLPGGEVCTPCDPGSFSSGGAIQCTPCAPNTYSNTPGWPQCLPCPPGSFSPNASNHCDTTCVFQNGGQTFDLSPLASIGLGPIADNQGASWFFSVCRNGNNASVCPSSRVCAKQGASSNTLVSHGYTVGFFPTKNNTGNDYFFLEFANGDVGDNCLDGSRRSTILQFDCDTESSDSLPKFITTDANCTSFFSWTTSLACPVCKDNDYHLEIGSCDGTQQSVTKVRHSICNGVARIAQPSQGCMVEATFPLAALLVPLLAFIALLVLAIVMFIRHRRIAKQYSVLLAGDASRRASIEMTNAPLFAAGSPPTSP